jgi:hypothetical protein
MSGMSRVLAGLVGIGAALPMWVVAGSAPARPPTFYADIAPILQQHCQMCHGPGASNTGGHAAPQALVTYEQVRPLARAIVRKVQAREMPPWLASRATAGVFANERGLTDQQIQTFAEWERAGAPAGAAAETPARRSAPVIPGGWSLADPDIEASFSKPHWIPDDVADETVSLDTGRIPEDVWVQGVELKPGSAVVHHMCVTAVAAPGTTGPDRELSLGCIAGGSVPWMLPQGYAFFIPRNSTIRFHMHYHKAQGPKTGVSDTSDLGLTISKGPVGHRVRFNAVGHTTFEIPPGQTNWKVGAARVFEAETTLLALWPHAHLRAAAVKYWAVYPDGTRETLLDIPRYDQAWQETYVYRTPRIIPAGTRIEVLFSYDNSEARGAKSGFDSRLPVRFGASTVDEMALGYIAYSETGGTANRETPIVNRDAVDNDRLLVASAALPSGDVEVAFPKLSTTDAAFRQLETLPAGSVLGWTSAAAIKLRAKARVTVAGRPLTAGVAYGLWLKKAGSGWHVVFTSEPDVWGTQFDPGAIVAEAPVAEASAPNGAAALSVRLEPMAAGSQMVISWGTHIWTLAIGP